MTKGRKPDPTRAKRGTGNRPKPGEAKKSSSSLVLVSSSPTIVEQFPPPESLPKEVHDLWRAIISDLGGANHMRQSFVSSVEVYCEAVYIHAQASANINSVGVLVKGQNGPMPNPLLKVQKDAAATMLRYADSLGLTPAARIRLGLMEITGMSLLSSINSSIEGAK